MKIKVRIPAVIVEVDVEAWACEYGCGSDASTVRSDVRAYFDLLENIPEHLSDIVTIPE